MPLRAPTHFLVVMPTLVIVFIAAMISAGCGGGSKQTKATPLNQQYEQALKIPAHDVRATRLIGIATQQVARKNEIAADKTLEAAILAAKSVDNAGHRADIFLKVFALRAATGQAGISRDVLKDASRAIENVDQPSQKFSLLLRLANSYAKDMEKPISAKAALKEAEALLPELPDHEKLAGRIRLSGSLELAGEAERSQEMLAAALEEANNLEDGRAKAEALGDAAAALFELERNEEASAHLQTAEEAAAGLNDAESRSHALSSLGRKLMMCGQNAKAGAMLKKAMSAAEEVGDPTMRNSIMDEINASKRLLAE